MALSTQLQVYQGEKGGIDWKETTKNEFINVKLDLEDSRIQNDKSSFVAVF